MFFRLTMMFILELLCSELYAITFLSRITKLVILDNFVVGLKDKRNIVGITDLVFQNLENDKLYEVDVELNASNVILEE